MQDFEIGSKDEPEIGSGQLVANKRCICCKYLGEGWFWIPEKPHDVNIRFKTDDYPKHTLQHLPPVAFATYCLLKLQE